MGSNQPAHQPSTASVQDCSGSLLPSTVAGWQNKIPASFGITFHHIAPQACSQFACCTMAMTSQFNTPDACPGTTHHCQQASSSQASLKGSSSSTVPCESQPDHLPHLNKLFLSSTTGNESSGCSTAMHQRMMQGITAEGTLHVEGCAPAEEALRATLGQALQQHLCSSAAAQALSCPSILLKHHQQQQPCGPPLTAACTSSCSAGRPWAACRSWRPR